MTDYHLDRDERLMLTLLAKQPLATWALSGMITQEWTVTFNRLHHKGFVTPINGYMAYDISDAGKAALLSAHGLSFFDMTYRVDEGEDFTW